MQQLLKEKYNLKNPAIKQLPGYDFQNFKIDDETGKYILKVYPFNKITADFTEAENNILCAFSNKKKYPQVIKNTDNQYLTFSGGKIYRLLTFLEGDFFAETKHSAELFRTLGTFLATMNVQLQNVKNYVVEARQFEWDLQYIQFFFAQKSNCIKNPSERKLVDYFLQQHRQHVVPYLPKLRKQIIHNDGNDWNVLVQNGKISGIIDFGDVCNTQLINELAIGIAYAILNKDNPVEWAVHIIKGYHTIIPLFEIEIDLLYWLIAGRLCASVCNSAFEKTRQPHNQYISVSEKPAWKLLEKWLATNPVYVKNEFRKAVGFKIPVVKPVTVLQSERIKLISPVFSISYKKPVYLESAAFQYMFDKFGNRFLDAYNNIPHVGHSHPKVVEAGQHQMAKLNTNTRYLYDQLNEYTARLLQYFPKPLNKVFLVNSGSAATDLALRMARHFTNRKKVAVVEHGYHGNTGAGIEISHYKFNGKGGAGATENVVCIPIPDTFRGEFRTDNAGIAYAEKAIHKIRTTSENPAAFIAEPIVGCGGQVPLPNGYLPEMYEQIRKMGGICISDEVQTGFGRLGNVFWGFESYNVVPDMVILGKPMGNGHPIGAVVTTNEIAEAFNNGMEFFSSFGGNPVSCAIGQAVLDVLEDEQLQQNAKITGDYYIQQLTKLQQNYEQIGDVRGSGLFIGFELVKNHFTREPNTKLAQKIKNQLREQFVLVSTDGPHNNVIKSKPPLCFSKENVDEVLEKLEGVLK